MPILNRLLFDHPVLSLVLIEEIAGGSMQVKQRILEQVGILNTVEAQDVILDLLNVTRSIPRKLSGDRLHHSS